jgi:acyl-CoA oxidase
VRISYYLLEQREFTLQRVKKLLHCKIASIYDMKSNPTKFLAFLDCVTVMDVNLAVKFGVHMTLFGSSVINLGTEKHHEKYLPGIDTFEIAGCFGMTELGNTSVP